MHTVCSRSLSLIRFAGHSAGGASRGNFIYVGQVNSCIMRAMYAMRAEIPPEATAADRIHSSLHGCKNPLTALI